MSWWLMHGKQLLQTQTQIQDTTSAGGIMTAACQIPYSNRSFTCMSSLTICDCKHVEVLVQCRVPDLARLYVLCSRIQALEALKGAFRDYIGRTGLALVLDEEKVSPCPALPCPVLPCPALGQSTQLCHAALHLQFCMPTGPSMMSSTANEQYADKYCPTHQQHVMGNILLCTLCCMVCMCRW